MSAKQSSWSLESLIIGPKPSLTFQGMDRPHHDLVKMCTLYHKMAGTRTAQAMSLGGGVKQQDKSVVTGFLSEPRGG